MRPALLLPLLLAACAGDGVPRDRVTVLGSGNLLPGAETVFRPTLAETLLDRAGATDRVLRATGNGEAMALLCARPDAVAATGPAGEAALLAPDLVLLTRPPASLELELCRRNGIAVETRRLAVATAEAAAIAPDITGIWLVADRAQAERSDVTARVLTLAVTEAAALVDSGPYAGYFRAGG